MWFYSVWSLANLTKHVFRRDIFGTCLSTWRKKSPFYRGVERPLWLDLGQPGQSISSVLYGPSSCIWGDETRPGHCVGSVDWAKTDLRCSEAIMSCQECVQCGACHHSCPVFGITSLIPLSYFETVLDYHWDRIHLELDSLNRFI